LKLAYLQNNITDSNPILHNDKDHQVYFVNDPEQAQNKFKMAYGRHVNNNYI